jgi:arylsulfatase A-like enzyme
MPNHASMLGGMTPDKHGILWIEPYPEAPTVISPTLFSVAHEAHLSTAMIVGKAKLEYLVLPDSVDNFLDAGPTDTQVKDRAIEIIQTDLPNILFIHLPNVDTAGHDTGWLSPGQLQALTLADGLIGELVAALEAGGYLPTTILIVTSDHGGHGTGHGSDSSEDTTIPWLAVGPGISAGMTLTSDIVTYDTAATVLYVLNLPIPEIWDGKPVLEIFE